MKQKFTMPDGELIDHEMPMFKTPYNHDRNFESDRTALYCPEPSLTKQEFKDECDINTILERFTKTGEPPPITLPEHFGDLTSRLTYYDAATAMAEANRLFYLLPPSIRAEHLNDPNRWADAMMVALEKGDTDALNANGIQVERKAPETANPGTPPTGGTPAPAASGTPSPTATAGGAPATP